MLGSGVWAGSALAWIAAVAPLAVASREAPSSKGALPESAVREERGVTPLDSPDRPGAGASGDATGAAPLEDIHGKEGSLRVLLLGDGRGDLRGVRREFRAIVDALWPLRAVGYLHVDFLVGPDLTKKNLESRLLGTRYSVVHYAGHTREMGRVLPFADSEVETLEFITLVARNPPFLLVMDACNSLGDPQRLELSTPLFVKSGAIFALGTSSVVRDDVPADVFPHFYASLIRGRPIGQAFNDAERRHRGALVQYQLLGNPMLTLK